MLFPQRPSNSTECPLAACDLRDILGLHPALDRIGRIEDEVIAHPCHGPSRHLLPNRQRLFLVLLVHFPEQQRSAFIATEPGSRASGLTNQGT